VMDGGVSQVPGSRRSTPRTWSGSVPRN